MNRRRFLRAALAAAGSGAAVWAGGNAVAAGRSGAGAGPAGTAFGRDEAARRAVAPLLQHPAGVTGADYFPVYYAWYRGPSGWQLNADYLPALGRYVSQQRGAIAQHLDWLETNGGAGFAINWHGPAGFIHDTVAGHFIPELGGFPGQEFCIHYDPFIRWGLPLPDFARDGAAAALWRADARYLARNFMAHPQYARIDGRPLLFIYLARAIEGLHNIEAFVDIARREAADAGHPGVYLVLGEVWWIPTDETPFNLEVIRAERAPRTRLADAVYSYNLATEPVHERIWRGNVRTFMGEAGRVYKDYRNLMDARGAAGTPLVTTLMPRFDNTVLSVFEGRPPGMNIGPWRGYDGLDYEHDVTTVFDKLATSFEPVRGDRTVMLVTSWNEWPERTALEPAATGIDKDGLPAPDDAYLTSLARAVATFGQPSEPVLRRDGASTTPRGASGRRAGSAGALKTGNRERTGGERAAGGAPPAAGDPPGPGDAAPNLSGLTAEQTERVTLRDITGGRVRFRRLLQGGGW